MSVSSKKLAVKSKPKSLLRAVSCRNYNLAREIVSSVDMAAAMTDCRGWTAVHHAAYLGDHKMLKVLLEPYSSSIKKELVNRRTWLEETPLIIACNPGSDVSQEIVHILLLNGADPDLECNGKSAVFYLCASKECLNFVRLLRDMGATVRLPALLNRAYAYERRDLYEYLLRTVNWSHSQLSEAFTEQFRRIRHIFQVGYRLPFQLSDEDVERFLKYLHPAMLDEMFILVVFFCETFPEGGSKEKRMKLTLKHFSSLGQYVTFSDDALSESCEDTDILFRYFPRQSEKGLNLQMMCRPVVRTWLAQKLSSSYEAYDWICHSSLLPPSIKNFLLYQTENDAS